MPTAQEASDEAEGKRDPSQGRHHFIRMKKLMF